MSICLRCWDDASFLALMHGVGVFEKYTELLTERQTPEEQTKCREYTERMEYIAFASPIAGRGN